MKKCPSCNNTYEDSLRFCQTDGTPLIDDEPAFDPYATIVAPKSVLMPEEPAAAADVVEPEMQAAEASPIAEPDDLLDLPTPDPLKTMFASDAEMKEVLEVSSANNDTAESVSEATSDEVLSEPSVSSFEPESSFSPPPSPFAEPAVGELNAAPAQPHFDDEPATVIQSGSNPFDVPAAAPMVAPPSFGGTETPAAMGGSFDDRSFGGEQLVEAANQNKTLAIVSLVLGILGLTLCCGTLIPSLIAIITGFMARGKASGDPMNYGGAGMALGGLITGILGLLIGIAYLVFMFLLGGLQMVNQSGGF